MTVNEDVQLLFTGESGISVANLTSVALSVAHGVLTVDLQGNASVRVGANSSVALTIAGTQVDINATLATLAYRGDSNYNGSDTLTVTSTDADALTDEDTVAITVNAVNDAPAVTVPDAQTVNEDTDLAISGISVDDVDAASGSITLTFEVTSGTLTVGTVTNGAVVSKSGTASVTLTGTLSQVNTTLSAENNVVYRGTSNFNGSDTLTVTANDGGSTGSGGTLTDSKTVAITVNAVNDAPVAVSGSASIAPVDEGTLSPPGATVASLFGGNFSDPKDAVTAAVSGGSTANGLLGIVVVANATKSAEGKWQYGKAGIWNDMSTDVSTSSGLFLSFATPIRFLPAANFYGAPGSLTVRLVDDSGPAPTGSVNVTGDNSGGTTGISSASVVLSTSITAIPAQPSNLKLQTAKDDTGSSSSDGWTYNTFPTFEGTADSRAFVEILDYTTSTTLGTVQADDSGKWTFVMVKPGKSLGSDGFHAIRARANYSYPATSGWSDYSDALIVNLDTVSPAAPQTPVLDPSSDTGKPGDNITTDDTPTLTVTAPSDAVKVTVFLTNNSVTPANLSFEATPQSGINIWQATTTTLATGTWTVVATAEDRAGNRSTSSPPLSLAIRPVPAQAATPDLVASDDSGVSNTDNYTNVQKPTFTVTAPAGTTAVELFVGTTSVGAATRGTDGVTWSRTLDQPLPDGPHAITAKVTDDAGAVSPASAALSVTIDTGKPSLQSFGAVTPQTRNTPVSSIDATFNERVFLVAPTAFRLLFTPPGGTSRTLNVTAATTTPSSPVTPIGATASGASTWTLGSLDSLTRASGTYTLSLAPSGYAVVMDQAGNALTYTATPTRQWTMDVTPPTVTSIVLSPSALQLRNTAVTSATITFSEAVTGVDANDFELLRDETIVPLTGASLSPASGPASTYVLSALGGLTATSGSYTLRLKASGSGIADSLGNALALDGGTTWQMDATAPTGGFEPIATPLGTTRQSIGLTFSEPVTGVEKADFSLTRNGVAVSLANVTLTPSSGPSATYALTGLGSLTGTSGTYVLTLSRSTGTPIKDLAGNALAADITQTWTVDTTAPTATIALTPPLTNVAANTTKSTVTSATVTFTLPVTGVDVGDFRLTRDGAAVSLAGATITGSGTTWTLGNLGATATDGAYALTLVAAGSNIVRSVAPANALATDAVARWTMDTTPPTPTLSVVGKSVVDATTVKFTVQALFDEPVTGLALSKVAVSTGGSAANLRAVSAVGGYTRQYLFDVTVSQAPRAPVTVTMNANAVTDVAGNGSGSKSLPLITDFQAPTVVLTGPALTNASRFTVRATFSENVTGFDATNVVVTNGTATSVTAVTGTRVFDVVVTPAADGTVGVAIPAKVATDTSGNKNLASNTLAVAVDRVAPTVALARLSSTPSRDSQLRFGATFSEPVTVVNPGNLTITNGNLVGVQGSGTTYVFVVAPAADGDVTASLRANVAVDAAGNGSQAAPADAKITSDRTPPTVAVSAPVGGIATITFSEPIRGFDINDLRLTRDGAVLKLPSPPTNPSGNRTTWSLGLGQTVALRGRYVLRVIAAGSGILDDAGNPLQADGVATFAVDTTPPLATIDGIKPLTNATIDQALINFTEPVTGFDTGDLELRRDNVVVPLTPDVTVSPGAGPAAGYLIQGLAALTAVDGTYSLRLRALGSGITDGSGNAFAVDAIATWVRDTTAPAVFTLGPVTPWMRTSAVTTVPITFSEPVTGLDVPDFTLRRDGVAIQLAGAGLTQIGTDGRAYSLTGLAPLTTMAGAYELELRTAGTGITDRAGNPLAAAAIVGWVNSGTQMPTTVAAAFVPVTPNPRTTAVASATVAFTAPVTGVHPGDFELIRTIGGSTTDLVGFSVAGSGSEWTVTDLGALTAKAGTYELRLRAAGSGIATAGGLALKADAVTSWMVLPDTSVPPTATVTADNLPADGTAIDAVTIRFSSPVSGLTLGALRLTRNTVPVSLSGAVLTGSGTEYHLRGLAPIAASAASYQLTLVAAGSGVADASGLAPVADASVSWTVTTTTVRAAFLAVMETRTTPVEGVQVRFSTLVKGVDVRDFELTFNGQVVGLPGVTVSGSGASWIVGNLAPLQSQRGTYTLRLKTTNGDILDANGLSLAADAFVTWTIV